MKKDKELNSQLLLICRTWLSFAQSVAKPPRLAIKQLKSKAEKPRSREFVKNARKQLSNIKFMRLKEKYKKEIVKALSEKFGYSNEFLVPRLEKVVINCGFGHHFKEKEFIASVQKGLTLISGQKAVLTEAKKSISAFKIREGLTIGSKVTLRGARMYDFVDKLVNITFPRVRDFRGISENSVDRNGNLTVGFKEFVAFPEIHVEDVDNMFGLEICLATSAKNKVEGLEFFHLMGFPFKKDSK